MKLTSTLQQFSWNVPLPLEIYVYVYNPCSLNPATPWKLRIAGSAGGDGHRAAGGLSVACAVLTGKTREIKDNVIYWCIVKVKLQSLALALCVSSINYNLTEMAREGIWWGSTSTENRERSIKFTITKSNNCDTLIVQPVLI